MYWAGPCPLCRQGRLILQRNDATGAIYGHCEECEHGFDEPADVDAARGFLTLTRDYQSSDPNRVEIERSAWAARVNGLIEH